MGLDAGGDQFGTSRRTVTVFAALTLPLLVVLARRQIRRRAVAQRSATVSAGLATTIDLIVVVLGSGGTVYEAVSVVADHGPRAVRPAFEAVLSRSESGVLLADALSETYRLLTPAFHPLIGVLLSADRDGGAMADLLRSLASDAEQARAWQLEAVAKRLSVSLIVPLVTCLLPAVVIGGLVPLIVVALRHIEA